MTTSRRSFLRRLFAAACAFAGVRRVEASDYQSVSLPREPLAFSDKDSWGVGAAWPAGAIYAEGPMKVAQFAPAIQQPGMPAGIGCGWWRMDCPNTHLNRRLPDGVELHNCAAEGCR